MARSGDPLDRLERDIEAILVQRQQAAQAASQEAPDSLREFIVRVSPNYTIPAHLESIIDLFERAASGEAIHACISMPPRHGKTETLLHAIAWYLWRDPSRSIAYIAATAKLALEQSSRAKQLTRDAGVKLSRETAAKGNWHTTKRGGLWATGIEGQINGKGFQLVIIDDPHKDRAEAESSIIREGVHSWLMSDAYTRRDPRGSAVIVVHTRWHEDDLIGRLTGKRGSKWHPLTLPAINANGDPLWPDMAGLDWLLDTQEELGPYAWASLYQQEPQPSGSALFHGSHIWDVRPPLTMARIVIGVDFAYSSKTSADYSVAVVLAELGGRFYVLEVLRFQGDIRTFRDRVSTLVDQYPGSSVAAYAAATEAGGVEFLRDAGLPIVTKRARVDKLSNALPTSAGWNAGKIFIPKTNDKGEPFWVAPFLSEVRGFTGKGDRHDDQVDALCAAYDTLRGANIDWDFHAELDRVAPRALSFF